MWTNAKANRAITKQRVKVSYVNTIPCDVVIVDNKNSRHTDTKNYAELTCRATNAAQTLALKLY